MNQESIAVSQQEQAVSDKLEAVSGVAGKYQPYPEYRESGVEWLGKVPVNWGISRIKYLATLNPSKSEVRHFPADSMVSFIPMEAIGESGELDNSRTKPLGEVLSGYTYIANGDVMLAKITPCFENGKAAIASGLENGIGFATTEVIPVRPKRKLDARFFYYLLHSDPFKSLAEGAMYGAGGQKRVADGFVAEYHFALPDAEERDTIAAFLDHETARIDALIAKQQRLIALLKEKRQAVISHAVTKGLNLNASMKDSGVEWLGQVPAHWEVKPMKFIAELNPPKSKYKGCKTELCSFIPMDKLKLDWIGVDEKRVISEVFDGYTYFEDGDVLLAKVTPCFENKNMAIAQNLCNGVGFGSSEIYVLRPYPKACDIRFFFYRLQEENFIAVNQAAMTGAGGLKRVPSESLSNYQVALPEMAEQIEIRCFLDQVTAKLNLLIERSEGAIRLFQERRTALISAAVTGKIDVRGWQPPAGVNEAG